MLFEVTKEEICNLDDASLRELVGRLCNAEAEANGFGSTCVRYGGDQNASDGGVDVDVHFNVSDSNPRLRGNLKKGHTIIQVKKPSMPPTEIKREMSPSNSLRPIFSSLADEKGNYIIVSSADDLTYSMREKRINAMRSELGTIADSVNIDFYDVSDLVSWCNQYVTVVCWVKHYCGIDSVGWRPYGDWTGSDGTPFLHDGSARLQTPDCPVELNLLDGLVAVRNLLRQDGKSVRLTGLSGVGKTRFAQAIFEEGIADNPVPSEKVVYLDKQNEAKIPPIEMVEILQRTKTHAIVVVDNCSAKEHRLLTQKCTSRGSPVSVLTIEYDVQEDEPEDSNVYRMLPSSEDLIYHLISQRFPGWSYSSYHRIARLSGGNSRIALALAKSVSNHRDISELKDKELFERLFWQNGQPDSELHRTAKVCALVYSFSVGALGFDNNTVEIDCLANLAELSSSTLLRNIKLLIDKQLVQTRGEWRAVLPHALANRLAAEALDEIPTQRLISRINDSTPHMLRSFSKRLSYLHESEKSREVFRYWLTVSPLTSPSKWDELCQYRIEDATPVIPGNLLTYLEELCAHGDKLGVLKDAFDTDRLGRVLMQIAYDSEWFERSVTLLSWLPTRANSQPHGVDLFQIEQSGTKAPLSSRLSIIRSLLFDTRADRQKLGFEYLKATLRCGYSIDSNGLYLQEFGSHHRDDGWSPKTHQEAYEWYREVIDFVKDNVNALPSVNRNAIFEIISDSFQMFWNRGYVDVVEYCCDFMNQAGVRWWAWIGLGQIKFFYSENMSSDEVQKLSCLIAAMEPTDLIERSVCFIKSGPWKLDAYFPPEKDYTTNTVLIEELHRLGLEASKKTDDLITILSLIDDSDTAGYFFGEALAEGEIEAGSLWPILVHSMSGRNVINIPYGYLHFHQAQRPDWVTERLIEAECPETLKYVIKLWASLDKGKPFLLHIEELLAYGKLDFSDLEWFCYFIGSMSVEEIDIISFLDNIRHMSGGLSLAITLTIGYCTQKERYPKNATLSTEMQKFVRSLVIECINDNCVLSQAQFGFGKIVVKCFGPSAPDEDVILFFRGLPSYLDANRVSAIHNTYEPWLKSVACAHSSLFLSCIFEADRSLIYITLFRYGFSSANLLNMLDTQDVISWADSPEKRTFLAEMCEPFAPDNSKWSDLAYELLHSEDGIAVLNIFSKRFHPSIWENSLANILNKRLVLFQELATDTLVGDAARSIIPNLEAETKSIENWERERAQKESLANQRFEY